MALLGRWIGRTRGLPARDASTAGVAACPHDQRDPRWDSMADAGQADRIDHYLCRLCGQKLATDV